MAIGVKVVKGSTRVARARRHFRVRKKVSGTAARPRLVVSRSTRHVFAQVVDDTTGKTLVSASTMESELAAFLGRKVDLVSRRAVERRTNWIRRQAILGSAEIVHVAR